MPDEPKKAGKKSPGKIDRNDAVISLKGVQKAFGDMAVLKGVDLDVFKGDRKSVV